MHHSGRTTATLPGMRHGVRLPGLADARRRRLLKQEELATAAGLSRITVSRLETHPTRGADFETVRRLAKALDVPPEELMRDQ